MRVLLFALLVLALVVPPGAVASDEYVTWTTSAEGSGDVRVGVFEVADAHCAYELMADADKLVEALEHLEGVDIHEERSGFQDLTLHERFFLVGLVKTRYHRNRDGDHEVSWRLIEGRQKRHDGTWTVTPFKDGGGRVEFRNLIEAKSVLHRPLLRRIQDKTMPDIATATVRTCGKR